MADPQQDFIAAICAGLGGYAPAEVHPGLMVRFSTSGRARDTAGWALMYEDMRGGAFGDFRSGVAETWSATRPEHMTREQRAQFARQVAEAARQRYAERGKLWHKNQERIAHLWQECVPLVAGDPVTMYLKRRGMAGLWPLPACLRYHFRLPYWDGEVKLGEFPAMVAPLVAPDGRTVALHRTYLTRDGRKADVPTPKKLTGACGPLAGACIPLARPVQGVIGIAEGIETALAASCGSGLSVVAAYSAGNLAAWQWPAGTQQLVVFADHDKAGREAADTLRARAMAAHLRCDIRVPEEDGTDWADAWSAHGVDAFGQHGEHTA